MFGELSSAYTVHGMAMGFWLHSSFVQSPVALLQGGSQLSGKGQPQPLEVAALLVRSWPRACWPLLGMQVLKPRLLLGVQLCVVSPACRPNAAGAWRSKATLTRCASCKLQSMVRQKHSRTVCRAPAAGSGVSMQHRLLRWMRCCRVSRFEFSGNCKRLPVTGRSLRLANLACTQLQWK